jgi:hypothetical protein
MTSSSPVPVPASPSPSRLREAPTGELGFTAGRTEAGSPGIWFMASCDRCNSDLAQPFRVQSERDQWAVAHLVDTGHVVRIGVDGIPDSAHLTAYLRRTADGNGFKWLCPGDAHPAWIGNYETVQLALADWRSHSGVSVR